MVSGLYSIAHEKTKLDKVFQRTEEHILWVSDTNTNAIAFCCCCCHVLDGRSIGSLDKAGFVHKLPTATVICLAMIFPRKGFDSFFSLLQVPLEVALRYSLTTTLYGSKSIR